MFNSCVGRVFFLVMLFIIVIVIFLGDIFCVSYSFKIGEKL